MSYKDITAGNKTARMVAARVIKSEQGTTGIEVAFKFKEGESEEQLNWVGWLSPKALSNTMKTLTDVLGFNGDDQVSEKTGQFKAEAFDLTREVQLVVEMETYDGKTNPRVKWVNKPGAGSGFKSLSGQSAQVELAAVGFKAAFYQAKAELSAAGAPQAAVPAAAPKAPVGHIPEEEVPF